jgi:excisionase family DNA binding protein
MDKSLLSTTDVAKLLAVTPDTVLKWVKAGKIQSYRTPGGHSRIPKEEVTRLLAQQANNTQETLIRNGKTHQYCWDYLAVDDEVKDECKDCITYRSRASRCYELRDLPGNLGCLRMYCASTCDECDYFKLMEGTKANILIVSENQHLLIDKEQLKQKKAINVQFVDNEYECSQLIEKFRPDYIIVDVSFGKNRTSSFCNYLFSDSRIPVARIVVASKTKEIEEYCDKEIFGWIRKPFSTDDLKEYIEGVAISDTGKKAS